MKKIKMLILMIMLCACLPMTVFASGKLAKGSFDSPEDLESIRRLYEFNQTDDYYMSMVQSLLIDGAVSRENIENELLDKGYFTQYVDLLKSTGTIRSDYQLPFDRAVAEATAEPQELAESNYNEPTVEEPSLENITTTEVITEEVSKEANEETLSIEELAGESITEEPITAEPITAMKRSSTPNIIIGTIFFILFLTVVITTIVRKNRRKH